MILAIKWFGDTVYVEVEWLIYTPVPWTIISLGD